MVLNALLTWTTTTESFWWGAGGGDRPIIFSFQLELGCDNINMHNLQWNFQANSESLPGLNCMKYFFPGNSGLFSILDISLISLSVIFPLDFAIMFWMSFSWFSFTIVFTSSPFSSRNTLYVWMIMFGKWQYTPTMASYACMPPRVAHSNRLSNINFTCSSFRNWQRWIMGSSFRRFFLTGPSTRWSPLHPTACIKYFNTYKVACYTWDIFVYHTDQCSSPT